MHVHLFPPQTNRYQVPKAWRLQVCVFSVRFHPHKMRGASGVRGLPLPASGLRGVPCSSYTRMRTAHDVSVATVQVVLTPWKGSLGRLGGIG